jgi:excisionase family DNA binding protein
MGSRLANTLAYPPRALRADRAAAYLDISTPTFLRLVEQGRLPAGRKLAGITFWDRVALDDFVERYEGEQDTVNPWDKYLESEHKK